MDSVFVCLYSMCLSVIIALTLVFCFIVHSRVDLFLLAFTTIQFPIELLYSVVATSVAVALSNPRLRVGSDMIIVIIMWCSVANNSLAYLCSARYGSAGFSYGLYGMSNKGFTFRDTYVPMYCILVHQSILTYNPLRRKAWS